MDVKEHLEQLAPETERLPDWDAVLRDARPSRIRWAVPRLAIIGAVIAAAALVAVAPWREAEPTGILDRALAAVGDGEVLHVVFRGEWGGTVVDLETGKRRPAYGESEVWYDPKRDLVHSVSRFGGVVEREQVFERSPKDKELTTLWQDYRSALERGTARLVEDDVVDGVPVHWIIVRSQMLPDVADGKDHEFAQQVAVSKETYKPVAMRYTRDRKAPPGSLQRILRYETVSAEEADFKAEERSLDGMAFSGGETKIKLDQAADVLGRTPLWLGERHADLPLAQTSKLEVATGSRELRVLRGEEAALAKRCLAGLHARARRGAPARRPPECRVGRRLGGLQTCGKDVCTRGPVEWTTQHTGVVLFYGTLGDDPTRYRTQSVPQFDEPYVSITQSTDSTDWGLMGPGVPMRYRPPEGSIVITATRAGYFVIDGLHVSIRATDEQAVLAAARGLRPLSAGSGAGE
jgi:hypothetical protein